MVSCTTDLKPGDPVLLCPNSGQKAVTLTVHNSRHGVADPFFCLSSEDEEKTYVIPANTPFIMFVDQKHVSSFTHFFTLPGDAATTAATLGTPDIGTPTPPSSVTSNWTWDDDACAHDC